MHQKRCNIAAHPGQGLKGRVPPHWPPLTRHAEQAPGQEWKVEMENAEKDQERSGIEAKIKSDIPIISQLKLEAGSWKLDHARTSSLHIDHAEDPDLRPSDRWQPRLASTCHSLSSLFDLQIPTIP